MGRPPRDHTAGLMEEPRAADLVFGKAPTAPPNPNIVARPISVYEIKPDPIQPRRALPSEVRNNWNYGDPRVLFDYWLDLAEYETSRDRSNNASYEWLEARAVGTEAERDEWHYEMMSGPVATSLLAVADLAHQIYDDGLINPITVFGSVGDYQIETGERRWLAYLLLHTLTKDSKWEKIPARVMADIDVFRQAAENTQRANLNAISKARQYALLLLSLNPDADLLLPHQCSSDRDFYAQSIALRIPHGQRGRVLNALGLTSPGQLSSYTKFLELPDAIWQQADDENWPESKMFSALNISEGKPKRVRPVGMIPAPDQKSIRRLLALDGEALANLTPAKRKATIQAARDMQRVASDILRKLEEG